MKLMPFFLFMLLGGCTIDRTLPPINEEEGQMLAEFLQLPTEHVASLAGEKEMGEPLLLCLTFCRKEDPQPVPSASVHFYQAGHTGDYEPRNPADESTARLNGIATTNSQGRILLRTILPGDYGSTADNRHIHTTVYGARPEAYDIHFRQYANQGLQRFVRRSDQHFLADLRYAPDSTLIGFLTLFPKGIP